MNRDRAPETRAERRAESGTMPVDPVTVHLHAGQVFAAAVATRISTVLGSCVAVCFIDVVHGIGGANHFMLPLHVSGAIASPRFGNVAIEALIARMIALGSRKRDLQAKVFGGASPNHDERNGNESLGWQNVRVARRVLAAERIPIAAEDVGGHCGRRLLFSTNDGCAWVRRL
jgi:chemotaxis protein CheD